jgi:outer membrane cobalamin receptor
MKILLLNIAFMISVSTSGQMSALDDTIRISEVIVNGGSMLENQGSRNIRIDSTVLSNYRHDNISEVISGNSPVFIKNYGNGGIAVISIRGTGAGYTQLAWNGVNINSPMLGQTDLSIIPAGFIDELTIFQGGSSLSLGNGGIGGIINFDTSPDWRQGTGIYANLGTGSFGKYSALFKIKTGNKRFQSSTRALFQSAENNFTYQNNFTSGAPVEEQRKNASVIQNSFMQELYYRGRKNVFSAKIWYQKSNRNIPVPIVSSQPEEGASQEDEFLRTMLNYNEYLTKTDLSTSLSWFSEKLNYQNPLLSVDSRNRSNTFAFKEGLETILNEKTKLSFTLNDELSIINSVNYSDTKSRNLAGISASVRILMGEKTVFSTLVRQSVRDNSFLIPDFSAGFDYRLFNGRNQFLRINLSHNSKVPSCNDLYWNPGGNSSLKNEYSYTGELTYDMKSDVTGKLSYSGKISAYLISIDNIIKWVPGGSGYWTPQNISKANSSGLESNLNLSYVYNSFRLKFSANYAWNRTRAAKSQSGEEISNSQMIYTPVHLLNGTIRVQYRKCFFSWLADYTGRRYTSADNSEFLPGYLLNNASAGIKFGAGKNQFEAALKAENLFNVSYQVIAWYPMPGRSFNLSLIYQFLR